MRLREARKINGDVAQWYMGTAVFGEKVALPLYPKDLMLEAFRVVEKANNLRPVWKDGKMTICVVCDPRIADMVVSLRGW